MSLWKVSSVCPAIRGTLSSYPMISTGLIWRRVSRFVLSFGLFFFIGLLAWHRTHDAPDLRPGETPFAASEPRLHHEVLGIVFRALAERRSLRATASCALPRNRSARLRGIAQGGKGESEESAERGGEPEALDATVERGAGDAEQLCGAGLIAARSA